MNLVLNFLNFLKLLGFILIISTTTYALETTSILPAKINSPSVRFGTISGLSTRFTNEGDLMTLNDINSIEFDVNTLSYLEPDIKKLVSALNNFGNGMFGDKLSLGTLHFDIVPELKYTAIIHSWGLNEKLSIGFGIPVIEFKTNVNVVNSGSNIESFKQHFGGISSEMDAAFKKLSLNLPQAANNELVARGYKPLESHTETFIGDINIAAVYLFYQNLDWRFAYKPVLILPTGPKPDPTDLLSPDSFGRTSLENNFLVSYSLIPQINFHQKVGLRYYLPDKVDKIVPSSDGTLLPHANTRETVNRQLGNNYSYALSGVIDLSEAWSIGTGYEFNRNLSDQYSGDQNKNYSALSKNTESNSHKSKFMMSFSSVKRYLKSKDFLPLIFELEYSDTFAGLNTPRQVLTEINLMLFY